MAIDHVRRLQDRTRHDLDSFWFPLVLFGLLTLASVPFAVAESGEPIAIFWTAAGPAGGAAIGWYYHRREPRIGASRSGLPFMLVGGGLIVAAFVLPAVTTGALQEVVSAFAVGAAYLVFARLTRSPQLAALGLVVATIAALALMSDLDRPGALVAATTGAAILATGLIARLGEQREE